jgi:acetylornithine deacetylase
MEKQHIDEMPHNTVDQLCHHAIEILKTIIATPSLSGDEKQVANFIEDFLNNDHGIRTIRKYNNIWCYNKCFDLKKPTILLTSHIDTVKPSGQWSRDPFTATVNEGKLYGVGSNDSGAALVSLISAFIYFYEWKGLPFNLCLALTAEEQTSGKKGIRSILPDLMPISFAIMGEPTDMDMAIEEMGAIVLDCISSGLSGHAAGTEGDNAIYRAMKDIEWFSTFSFPVQAANHQSVKMTVTEIKAGIRHNIVPNECTFTVDIRFDHHYNEKDIMNIIKNHTFCETHLRSNLMTPSAIDISHPLVQAGIEIGRKTYFSPTSSDRSLLNMPSLKMGPGSPERSHTSDEYVYLAEVAHGIRVYILLLESMCSRFNHHEEYPDLAQETAVKEAELIDWKA